MRKNHVHSRQPQHSRPHPRRTEPIPASPLHPHAVCVCVCVYSSMKLCVALLSHLLTREGSARTQNTHKHNSRSQEGLPLQPPSPFTSSRVDVSHRIVSTSAWLWRSRGTAAGRITSPPIACRPEPSGYNSHMQPDVSKNTQWKMT